MGSILGRFRGWAVGIFEMFLRNAETRKIDDSFAFGRDFGFAGGSISGDFFDKFQVFLTDVI